MKTRKPYIACILLIGVMILGSSYGFAQKQPKTKSKAKPGFWKGVKVKQGKKRSSASYSAPRVDKSDVNWKKVRLEYLLMTGGSGFLGDLGGQNEAGKPFLFDYDPTQTRYAISVGARYFFREYHAIRGTVTYARVRGTDAATNYPNRRFRNLTVKSPIFELAGVYEFHVLKPKYKHFAGASTTRVFSGNRFGAYGYGGLGVFGFNPRGQRNGDWYDLKPLNTEGQGLEGGSDPYRRINMSVPLGFGAYYLLNHNWKLGFDVGYRWTTTDYIDDAGGFYYDNNELRSSYGEIAAFFANPSVALDNVPNSDWYTEGQPRAGQEGNDTYFFFQVSVSKNLGPSITNKEFKSQKAKKGKSYKSKRVKNGKRKVKLPSLGFKKKGEKRRKRGVTTF